MEVRVNCRWPSVCSRHLVLLVNRKDGKQLHPVQDYRALNDITVKNATPLPLIPDLIDKLQGSRYFTKFDVPWGYNNIRIKEGDEWKATFKCILGLFEPLIMTFGLCNAPATFQSFMNSIFNNLFDDGHLASDISRGSAVLTG